MELSLMRLERVGMSLVDPEVNGLMLDAVNDGVLVRDCPDVK